MHDTPLISRLFYHKPLGQLVKFTRLLAKLTRNYARLLAEV